MTFSAGMQPDSRGSTACEIGSDGAASASGGRNPTEVLEGLFGFSSYREGQREVIERLLSGHSALAVFPTGSGKSLCYQLPALLLDGLTVVISPLIALMKDQIDFLRTRNVRAARLDSSLDREEAVAVYRELRSGALRLLYVSPERLGNERFLQLMADQPISLMAVDEAHCISQWGHNFRPDYLKIAALANRLQVGRVLALTATATPPVAQDIATAFQIAPENIVHTGFYRPNLQLHVTPCQNDDRDELLVNRLLDRPTGPTIVYVTLQRTAEEVAELLSAEGFAARPYHAGMKSEERTAVQEDFMAADSMIVVATIAFGMGIDKADIRAVYHYNLPKSLESYMQEIGRAGRDGQPADCEMLACLDDVVTLENFSYGDTPTDEAVGALLDELLGEQLGVGAQFDVSVTDLSTRHDTRDLVVKTLLTYLELAGVLQSTGHFYTTFRFQPLKPSAQILADFDASRAEFLQKIFAAARPGKIWFSLDAAEVGRQLGEPRDRIVAALDYLDREGHIQLAAAGVRQGFRLLRSPDDRAALARELAGRFAQREQQDIDRIARVIALAEHDGCLTRMVLEYFGESRDDCGHCDRCCGTAVQPMPPASFRAPGPADRDALGRLAGERHAALATSRQLARFLCGITSPATTRAKLRAHPDFGRLSQVPFSQVLALAESCS